MFIRTTINLKAASGVATKAVAATNTKEAFWSTFDRLDKSASRVSRGVAVGPSPDRTPDEHEERFRSNFARELENSINGLFDKTWKVSPATRGWFGWRQTRPSTPPKITVRLVDVGYGSITAVLEFLGISGGDARDFLLSVLDIYVPLAFQAALGTEVPVDADVNITDPGGHVTGDDRKSADGNRNVLGVIANGVLLLPVALAIGICYYVFDWLRKETEGLRTERTEIVKALLDHDTKMSTIVVDHAKNSLASANATQQLLVTLVTKKATDKANQPHDDGDKPKKPGSCSQK
jgi:hypothetical protein